MNRFTTGYAWRASATNEGTIARPQQTIAQQLLAAGHLDPLSPHFVSIGRGGGSGKRVP
jgi:hypothetical protein